jgi:hypothetical protein
MVALGVDAGIDAANTRAISQVKSNTSLSQGFDDPHLIGSSASSTWQYQGAHWFIRGRSFASSHFVTFTVTL